MAHPYEWSEEQERRYGYERREQEARRDAERHAGQDRAWDAGGYGADRGRGHGRTSDPSNFDRYDAADRVGDDLRRDWRRFSRSVRHAFEDRPPGYDADPRRGGGMFGGQDRPGSLFSHGDGLNARPVGPHRGQGPKGYVRSDARILEDVSDRLAEDGRLDASDIEVKVEAGEVTLNGHVASRRDKRRAEDLAEEVSGVKHLQNNLRVRPPEAAAAETRRSASMAGAAVGATQPSPPPRTH